MFIICAFLASIYIYLVIFEKYQLPKIGDCDICACGQASIIPFLLYITYPEVNVLFASASIVYACNLTINYYFE